ncbi:MAG: ThuA domain-containing protein [Propionibacteriaceae bacterium]|jgi:hypothetical protein|nr:ThuA domain-containing protein [Propionibacteriaceae bacterium]
MIIRPAKAAATITPAQTPMYQSFFIASLSLDECRQLSKSTANEVLALTGIMLMGQELFSAILFFLVTDFSVNMSFGVKETTMPQAMLISGGGRYADPWHDFNTTSRLLADLAREVGWDVTVVAERIDQALSSQLEGVDLLIVNTGDSWLNRDDATGEQYHPSACRPGRQALAAALERGMSVLAMHASAASLRDYPQFRQALGGQWLAGHSWHPDFGRFPVRVLGDDIVEGLCDFKVWDERYTNLMIDADVEPLLGGSDDQDDDLTLAWAHQYGRSRVVYDALGHDARSFDSKGHRSFLRRILNWLYPADTESPI